MMNKGNWKSLLREVMGNLPITFSISKLYSFIALSQQERLETEIYAYLAKLSYARDLALKQKFGDWQLIKSYENNHTGYQAYLFAHQHSPKICLISRGTDELQDAKNFPGIGLQNDTGVKQLISIFEVIEEIKKNYSGNELVLVGHSLGGYLSMQAGLKYPDAKVYSFDGPGLKKQTQQNKHISNIVFENNILYRLHHQPGKTIMVVPSPDIQSQAIMYDSVLALIPVLRQKVNSKSKLKHIISFLLQSGVEAFKFVLLHSISNLAHSITASNQAVGLLDDTGLVESINTYLSQEENQAHQQVAAFEEAVDEKFPLAGFDNLSARVLEGVGDYYVTAISLLKQLQEHDYQIGMAVSKVLEDSVTSLVLETLARPEGIGRAKLERIFSSWPPVMIEQLADKAIEVMSMLNSAVFQPYTLNDSKATFTFVHVSFHEKLTAWLEKHSSTCLEELTEKAQEKAIKVISGYLADEIIEFKQNLFHRLENINIEFAKQVRSYFKGPILAYLKTGQQILLPIGENENIIKSLENVKVLIEMGSLLSLNADCLQKEVPAWFNNRDELQYNLYRLLKTPEKLATELNAIKEWFTQPEKLVLKSIKDWENYFQACIVRAETFGLKTEAIFRKALNFLHEVKELEIDLDKIKINFEEFFQNPEEVIANMNKAARILAQSGQLSTKDAKYVARMSQVLHFLDKHYVELTHLPETLEQKFKDLTNILAHSEDSSWHELSEGAMAGLSVLSQAGLIKGKRAKIAIAMAEEVLAIQKQLDTAIFNIQDSKDITEVAQHITSILNLAGVDYKITRSIELGTRALEAFSTFSNNLKAGNAMLTTAKDFTKLTGAISAGLRLGKLHEAANVVDGVGSTAILAEGLAANGAGFLLTPVGALAAITLAFVFGGFFMGRSSSVDLGPVHAGLNAINHRLTEFKGFAEEAIKRFHNELSGVRADQSQLNKFLSNLGGEQRESFMKLIQLAQAIYDQNQEGIARITHQLGDGLEDVAIQFQQLDSNTQKTLFQVMLDSFAHCNDLREAHNISFLNLERLGALFHYMSAVFQYEAFRRYTEAHSFYQIIKASNFILGDFEREEFSSKLTGLVNWLHDTVSLHPSLVGTTQSYTPDSNPYTIIYVLFEKYQDYQAPGKKLPFDSVSNIYAIVWGTQLLLSMNEVLQLYENNTLATIYYIILHKLMNTLAFIQQLRQDKEFRAILVTELELGLKQLIETLQREAAGFKHQLSSLSEGELQRKYQLTSNDVEVSSENYQMALSKEIEMKLRGNYLPQVMNFIQKKSLLHAYLIHAYEGFEASYIALWKKTAYKTLDDVLSGTEQGLDYLIEHLESSTKQYIDIGTNLLLPAPATHEQLQQIQRITSLEATINLLANKIIEKEFPTHTIQTSAQVLPLIASGQPILLEIYQGWENYKTVKVYDEKTASGLAAYYGHENLVDKLIPQVQEPDQAGKNYTSLHLALINGYERAAEKYIEDDRYIEKHLEVKSTEGETPLVVACRFNLTDMAELLIEKGASVNILPESVLKSEQLTPLMWAVKHNNQELFELLIKNQADVTTQNAESTTALLLATQLGNVGVIKKLLNHGATPNDISLDYEGEKLTLLMWAVKHNNEELIDLLIKYKVDVTTQNAIGTSALLLATRLGNISVMRKLIDHGADPNQLIIDDEGEKLTPIMWAVKHDNEALFTILLEKGANINIQAGQLTALHIAIRKNDRKWIESLIHNGADASIVVNSPESDQNEITPLIWTIQQRDKKLFDLLVKKVNLNQVLRDDKTALYVAGQLGQNEEDNQYFVKRMMQEGADVNQKLINQKTALQLAIEEDNRIFAKNLIAGGADVTATITIKVNDKDLELTPLMWAIKIEDENIVKTIINHYGAAALNQELPVVGTALHFSAQLNSPKMISLLMLLGADITKKDANGNDALDIAKEYNSKEAARRLVSYVNDLINLDFIPSTRLENRIYSPYEIGADKIILRDNNHYMHFQGDGNLVIYSTQDMKVKWAADCHEKGGVKLKFLHDGQVIILNNKDESIWKSKEIIDQINYNKWETEYKILHDKIGFYIYFDAEGSFCIAFGFYGVNIGWTVLRAIYQGTNVNRIIEYKPFKKNGGINMIIEDLFARANFNYSEVMIKHILRIGKIGDLIISSGVNFDFIPPNRLENRIYLPYRANAEKILLKDNNHYMHFQTDGNLVIYSTPDKKVKWAADCDHKGGVKVEFMHNGQVAILNQKGEIIWKKKKEVIDEENYNKWQTNYKVLHDKIGFYFYIDEKGNFCIAFGFYGLNINKTLLKDKRGGNVEYNPIISENGIDKTIEDLFIRASFNYSQGIIKQALTVEQRNNIRSLNWQNIEYFVRPENHDDVFFIRNFILEGRAVGFADANKIHQILKEVFKLSTFKCIDCQLTTENLKKLLYVFQQNKELEYIEIKGDFDIEEETLKEWLFLITSLPKLKEVKIENEKVQTIILNKDSTIQDFQSLLDILYPNNKSRDAHQPTNLGSAAFKWGQIGIFHEHIAEAEIITEECTGSLATSEAQHHRDKPLSNSGSYILPGAEAGMIYDIPVQALIRATSNLEAGAAGEFLSSYPLSRPRGFSAAPIQWLHGSFPEKDVHTGAFIYEIHAIQEEQWLGSVKFLGRPEFCRSKHGDRHNVVGLSGIFALQAKEIDSLQTTLMCNVLPYQPETFFERAGNAATHGVLAGGSTVVQALLETSGFHARIAYAISQASYFTSLFGLHYYRHYNKLNEIKTEEESMTEAAIYAATQTGIAIGLKAASNSAAYLAQKCREKHWTRTAGFFNFTRNVLNAAVFAPQVIEACNQPDWQSSAYVIADSVGVMAVGAMAQTMTEQVGKNLLPKTPPAQVTSIAKHSSLFSDANRSRAQAYTYQEKDEATNEKHMYGLKQD